MCGSQGPNTPHLWAPHISTSSSLSHILSVLCLLPPSPPHISPFSLCRSFPLLPSGLSSLCFPSFLCVVILSASDELEGQVSPRPPLWTWSCETRLWFIYIFLASSWSLQLLILLLRNSSHKWEVADGYSGARGAAHERTSVPPTRHNNCNGFILTLLWWAPTRVIPSLADNYVFYLERFYS